MDLFKSNFNECLPQKQDLTDHCRQVIFISSSKYVKAKICLEFIYLVNTEDLKFPYEEKQQWPSYSIIHYWVAD